MNYDIELEYIHVVQIAMPQHQQRIIISRRNGRNAALIYEAGVHHRAPALRLSNMSSIL